MSSDVGWHIRDKLRPMRQHGSVNLYVHGNRKAKAQDSHLDSHTAPELCTCVFSSFFVLSLFLDPPGLRPVRMGASSYKSAASLLNR